MYVHIVGYIPNGIVHVMAECNIPPVISTNLFAYSFDGSTSADICPYKNGTVNGIVRRWMRNSGDSIKYYIDNQYIKIITGSFPLESEYPSGIDIYEYWEINRWTPGIQVHQLKLHEYTLELLWAPHHYSLPGSYFY